MRKISGPSYINLSQRLIETILTSLINEKKSRIEIHSYSPEMRNWFLCKKASPGNLQQLEQLLYKNNDMKECPTMMAVKISHENGHRTLGVAFCDMIFRKIGFCEFIDSEQLSTFSSLILQVGTKECLTLPVDEKNHESIKLHQVLERSDVVITSNCKRTNFDDKSLEQDLKKLLGTSYVNSYAVLDLKHAAAATACLISHLELLSNANNFNNFKLEKYHPEQFMSLDAAAIHTLNLVPDNHDSNPKHNLFGLINRCKTAMGARKLTKWIKQPLVDVDAIERRLDLVEIFVSDISLQIEIRNIGLRGIPDMERMIKNIYREKMELEDLVTIYAFLGKFPLLVKILSTYSGDDHHELLKHSFLDPLSELIDKVSQYCNMVEEVIDFAAIDEGEYQINPAFDESLSNLDNQKKKILSLIRQHEQEIKQLLKKPDHFSLEYDKVNGWVFRLTKKEEKILDSKENKIRFTLVATSKTGVKFQDRKLKQLSDEWIRCVNIFKENCAEIIVQIIDVVKTFIPCFEQSQDIVSELDVIVSLACASSSAIIPYTRPMIKKNNGREGCDIILKQSRHPILEAQADVVFIPNDVVLRYGSSRFMLITGPNMGGKSTYIRQTSLIVLMAQIGCFIPCDEGSIITVCDAILVRIGAGDSQLRGVSTFMSEMLETANILKTATSQSLIIIDELGRGTSTYDGFGLAWAISEYICNEIGAFCLFATHFHEITLLSERIPFVKNMHVSAFVDDSKGFLPEYNVRDGPSDQSFGIHVAKIAKFPDSVIEMAQQKVSELEGLRSKKNLLLIVQDQQDMTKIEGAALRAMGTGEEDDQINEFISKILNQFSQLDLEMMNDRQIQSTLEELKEEIDNSQIKGLKELVDSVV